MSAETFLSKKLQKLSIVDLGFVKFAYFIVGLLVYSLYPQLALLGWGFYLILALFCALPLWVHLFSQRGDLLAQMQAYVKTNNPSNQVLLFLTVFFFALMLGVLFPVLVSAAWWVYVIVVALLAIKPVLVIWVW